VAFVRVQVVLPRFPVACKRRALTEVAVVRGVAADKPLVAPRPLVLHCRLLLLRRPVPVLLHRRVFERKLVVDAGLGRHLTIDAANAMHGVQVLPVDAPVLLTILARLGGYVWIGHYFSQHVLEKILLNDLRLAAGTNAKRACELEDHVQQHTVWVDFGVDDFFVPCQLKSGLVVNLQL